MREALFFPHFFLLKSFVMRVNPLLLVLLLFFLV